MTILPSKHSNEPNQDSNQQRSQSRTPPSHHPPASNWLSGQEQSLLKPQSQIKKHKKSKKHKYPNSTWSTQHPNEVPTKRSCLSMPAAPEPSTSDKYGEGCNSEDEHSADPLFTSNRFDLGAFERNYETELNRNGLYLHQTVTDGACMFRAVALQLFGDEACHIALRKQVCDYMSVKPDDFSAFVTEDFPAYVTRKRLPHTHGNNVELQAICDLHNQSIELYQYSVTPTNVFRSRFRCSGASIKLSYHQNSHYNAVLDPLNPVKRIPLRNMESSVVHQEIVQAESNISDTSAIEKAMLEDKKKETDWEYTQTAIEEEVLRESYKTYVSSRKPRSRGRTPPTLSSHYHQRPSCSQSTEDPSPKGESAETQTKDVTEKAAKVTEAPPQTKSDEQESKAPDSTAQISWGDFITDDANEDDLLAAVLAQSQSEYLDQLAKTQAALKNTHVFASQPPPSKSPPPSTSS